MKFFSKERLARIVTVAKRHWFLFIPVFIIIMLGYMACSVFDWIQICLLSLRNALLFVIMSLRRAMRGVALLLMALFGCISRGVAAVFRVLGRIFIDTPRSIFQKASVKSKAFKARCQLMSENAVTARNQLLNSAVDFCEQKAEKRSAKKQALQNAAKAFKEDSHIAKKFNEV